MPLTILNILRRQSPEYRKVICCTLSRTMKTCLRGQHFSAALMINCSMAADSGQHLKPENKRIFIKKNKSNLT